MDPRRHLALEGAKNVRDLGGYSTTDGRRTRWRRFLRSSTMHRLTDADQKELLEYGVGTVIDLRMRREIEKLPNVFTDSEEVAFHHHDLLGNKLYDFKSSPESAGQAEKLADLYRTSFTECGDIIGAIMRTLAGAGDHASVFHCAAGKDRTGLISALLLGVAGVPAETIAADYALTDVYLDDPNRDHANPDPMALTSKYDTFRESKADALPVYMHSCLPETMSLTLAFLDEMFGGTVGYLRTAGLNGEHIEQLRTKLLD